MMTLSAGKLAPSAVVVAFVGYCIWPSLSSMTSGPQVPKTTETMMELVTSYFAPKLSSPPTKNPFGGLDADALAAAMKKAGQTSNTTAATVKPNEARPARNPFDPLGDLKLEATSILGDRRLAIINGKMYALKQKVPTGNAATPFFTIVEIHSNKVLLENNGKIADLRFSTVRSSPPAAKNADAAPSPSTPPTASPTTPPAAESAAKPAVTDTSLLKTLANIAARLKANGNTSLSSAGE
jgi:hypothetical protein